jgi:hypothetical protein
MGRHLLEVQHTATVGQGIRTLTHCTPQFAASAVTRRVALSWWWRQVIWNGSINSNSYPATNKANEN